MRKAAVIYFLTNNHLVDFLTAIENFLQDLKIDKIEKKDQISISLTFEKILLNLHTKCEKNAELPLFLGKHFRRFYISIQVKGEHFNPLLQENEEEDLFLLTPFLWQLIRIPMEAMPLGLFCILIMDFLAAAVKVAADILFTIEVACKHKLIASKK